MATTMDQEHMDIDMTTDDKQTDLRIATYKLCSGCNNQLEMAERAMDKMNVDMGFLTEAKLTNRIYTRWTSNYHMCATNS